MENEKKLQDMSIDELATVLIDHPERSFDVLSEVALSDRDVDALYRAVKDNMIPEIMDDSDLEYNNVSIKRALEEIAEYAGYESVEEYEYDEEGRESRKRHYEHIREIQETLSDKIAYGDTPDMLREYCERKGYSLEDWYNTYSLVEAYKQHGYEYNPEDGTITAIAKGKKGITFEDLKKADEGLEDILAQNPEWDDRPDSQIPEGMTQEEYFEAMGVSINEFGEIIRSETSPKKTVKEMSEEELNQIWVDNPEVLKELLSESELSIEELASLYVNHNILKNDILQMCDPEELLKTIREQMREERIQYTHPLFSDESKSLTEKEKIYKRETKKYADAISEIEDYIWMQEYDFSEPLEYDESYDVERKAELYQRKAEIEKRIAELDMLDDERLALSDEGYELSMLSIELEEIIEELEAYEAVEKTPLQQKEEELSALEAEAKTITEAEALISKQAEKNGEQK